MTDLDDETARQLTQTESIVQYRPHCPPRQARRHRRLLNCARAFHAADGYPLPKAGEAALAALIDSNSPYGRILVLDAEGEVAGYAVLCFGYSVEFGGRDAFVDDLYVAPPLCVGK